MVGRVRTFLLVCLMMVLLVACSGVPTVPAGQLYFYRNKEFVQPSLGLSTDFVLYSSENEQQAAAIAARYKDIYIEAQPFIEVANLPIFKDAYAKVGPTELGLIDAFILPPGNYYRIPAQDVTLVPAAVVVDPDVGILRGSTGVEPGDIGYTLLPPGIHRALIQQVRNFPTGPLRYRLISPELMDRQAAGGIDACQSTLCETTLGDVLTADTSVRVSVDLEVNFELVFEDSSLERLYALRDINTVITTYFSSPIRTKGRVLWSNITPERMQTGDGWSEMSSTLQDFLKTELAGQPIHVISVGIRGVDLPDAYLASQDAGVAVEQELESQLRRSQLSQEATATASSFLMDQQTRETEHLARQMEQIRAALDSDDPVVICGILNFFRPGSCVPALPFSLSVDPNNQP